MLELPYFRVYAAETLSDERFGGWSIDERGAWFSLVCHAWREGSIPSDKGALARLLHIDGERMATVWLAIGDRFVPHPEKPDRLVSARLEEQREAALGALYQRKEAGKAGATARWNKGNRGHGDRMPTARRAHPGANAVGMRPECKDKDQDQRISTRAGARANGAIREWWKLVTPEEGDEFLRRRSAIAPLGEKDPPWQTGWPGPTGWVESPQLAELVAEYQALAASRLNGGGAA